MTFTKEQFQDWKMFFAAAISGVAGDPNVDQAIVAANWAATVADAAMKEMGIIYLTTSPIRRGLL